MLFASILHFHRAITRIALNCYYIAIYSLLLYHLQYCSVSMDEIDAFGQV